MNESITRTQAGAEGQETARPPFNGELRTPVSFEFNPKDTSISLRLSSQLLTEIKAVARERGMSYQKFIRESLERACLVLHTSD